MINKKLIYIVSSLFLFTLPVNASSLPDADISQKVSIGTGPSVSLDFKLSSHSSLGVSLGAPLYRGIFTTGRYDARFLYKFVDQNKFALSGLVGVTGDPDLKFNFNNSLVGVEAGVALSYAFLPRLIGRLNIVGTAPFFGFGRPIYTFISPSSGIELGYKFTNNIEGTIGGNGQGDFLGLNIYF